MVSNKVINDLIPLFGLIMVLLHGVIVELAMISIKGYSTFLKYPGPER